MKKELLWLVSALMLWNWSAAADAMGVVPPPVCRTRVVVTPSGGVIYGGGWGRRWNDGGYDRARRYETVQMKWSDQLKEALEYAAVQQRGILLLLTVPGEPAGIQLEQEVFTDPELILIIQESVIPVRIYAPEGWLQGTTEDGKRFRELLNWSGVTWLPALLYLDSHGKILARGMGYKGNASQVIKKLKHKLRR